MKTLVIYAGGPLGRLRQPGPDTRVVLWDEERGGELERAGVPFRPLSSYVDAAERERVEQVAMAWTKAFGRRPLQGGQGLRELLRFGPGPSLWWWAELYLHHSTAATRCVRLVEAFNRLLEAEAPDEVQALGLRDDEALLLARTCTAWRALYDGPAPRPRRGRATLLVSLKSRLNTLKTFGSALKATLLGRPPRPAGSAATPVLFLSHAAFWRERQDPLSDQRVEYEHYFDRILPETAAQPDLAPFVVAVGPQAAFRRRGAKGQLADWVRLSADTRRYVHVNRYTRLRVFRETWRATRKARRLWRELRSAPGLLEALSHSGVRFGDLLADGLAATLLLQVPWAARSLAESHEVLRAVRPGLLVLYAESSGWGRAALAAAEAAGVPSVALQHGILYPGYFSYVHEADEGECPRPTRTAVFGTAARDFLVARGGYGRESLVLTGSPKFDALLAAAARWDRTALRQRLGLQEGERLVVLASRFRGIRSTYQAVGSAFPALVRAVAALPAARLLVKPHPAEPAAPYETVLRELGASRARALPASSDLLELLCACDLLVTVESLSAVEALALGRPVLVLNMPTNLAELVEAGAALGVPEGQDPAPALAAALFDEAVREGLRAARDAYVAAVAGGLDGQATARIVELLRQTARHDRAC